MMLVSNEHLATMIEDTIQRAPLVTSVVREGAEPSDLVSMALGEIPFEMVETREICFSCNCSFERAEVLISGLGKQEVLSMLEEDKGALMNCGFCNEEYELDENNLESILNEMGPDSH